MQKSFSSKMLMLSSLLVLALPAQAHPRYSIIDDLGAVCTNSGDSATASFVNDPSMHATVLKLTGRGMGLASGAATFANTTFHTISVLFKGDCVTNLTPASLIVRVKFIAPGTNLILDHGYDCAKNVVEVLPNGMIHMLITTNSLCDCNDRIPVGSQLVGISLNLTCADTTDSVKHKEMIYSVSANGLPVPFDLTAPSASCGN